MDGESDQQLMTKTFLKKFDPELQVESASSGEEALQLLKEQPFNCIVSDYQMLQMDGIELARRVREFSPVPFIIYTGHGSEEVAEMAFSVGVDDYLRKEHCPAHYQVLANRIRTAVHRDRAEKSLMESEERYRRLFEEALDAIFIAEAESGILVDCNRAASELIGRERSELIGKHQRILHPPDKTEGEFSESFKQHIAEKRGQVQETQVVTKGGEIKEVAIKANLFEIKGKKLIQGIFRDITERKKAERQVKREKKRLLDTIESFPDIVGIADLEGNLLTWNKAFERTTQFQAHEIIGKKFTFVQPKDQIPVAAKAFQDTMREGFINDFPLDFKRKDGQRVSTLASAVLMKDERGEPIEVFLVAKDITERKKVEEELRQSEEKHRGIFDNAVVGIFQSTLEGEFISVNPKLAQMLGYESPEEVIDSVHNISEQIYAEPKRRDEILQAIREVGVLTFESESLRKDGTKWIAKTNVRVVRVEKGSPLYLEGFMEDITEHKRMEEELRKHSEHLEKSVDEKTLELLDAEQMIVAGRIASMVGHDLKNPLQTIRNAAHLLREIPEQKDEMLDMIENSVMRANGLIEDFRSNVRDTPLSLVTVDLGALIEAAVGEAGIPDSVSVALEVEGVEAVSLDPSKLHRVLDNLVGNAVEAMPKGGVLNISADSSGKEIVIEVTDTGVGISEEEMPNLFKPFYTTKLKGLGLGLIFCKRAVEAHGGTITVESQVGEGSKFTVRIPLKAV